MIEIGSKEWWGDFVMLVVVLTPCSASNFET